MQRWSWKAFMGPGCCPRPTRRRCTSLARSWAPARLAQPSGRPAGAAAAAVAAAAQAPIAVLGQAWTLSQVSLLAGCAHLVCGMRVLEYVCKAVQPTSHANPPCLRACLPACLQMRPGLGCPSMAASSTSAAAFSQSEPALLKTAADIAALVATELSNLFSVTGHCRLFRLLHSPR
jgi:hypothetical protein